MKTKRTLLRWLVDDLGMCLTESKRYAGLTPVRAWAKAGPYHRYSVMRDVGIPHSFRGCPECNENARANKALPKRVLNAFRRWQKAK